MPCVQLSQSRVLSRGPRCLPRAARSSSACFIATQLRAASSEAAFPADGWAGTNSSVTRQQDPTATRQATGNYPFIDARYPGLELVHAEPPVYVIHNFLAPGHCHALKQAALAGQLPTAAYNDAVLFDYQRLRYLGFVVAAGAVAQGLLTWQHGASLDAVLVSAATAAACWAGAAAALAVSMKAAVAYKTKGRCFTGSKWSTGSLQPGNPAAEATEAFVNNVCSLLRTEPCKLEVPLVTRYAVGEYQRVHVDARPPGDSQGAASWLAAGGQRLVQCVAYLDDMDAAAGGATAFHHPLLKGLAVQPELGAALVFFPAFADGELDARMAHSGEPVLQGEKWIINTWAMQYGRPGSESEQ